MQSFELFAKLPGDVHYYFLNTLPADILVFVAVTCKDFYEAIGGRIHVDVRKITRYGNVQQLEYMRSLGVDTDDVMAEYRKLLELVRANNIAAY